MRTPNFAFVSLLALALSTSVCAAPVFFEAGGNANPSSIQATVDSFRAGLGNPNNGNAAGALGGGRREINWDGGGSTATTQNGTPLNTFLNNRGARFTTPGTGFLQAPEEGGTDGGLATFFVQPSYGATFNVKPGAAVHCHQQQHRRRHVLHSGNRWRHARDCGRFRRRLY
jgi:hypothetical protein